MTNYDEDETSWTTLTLVFTIIIATLGYRIFGPDRETPKEPVTIPTEINEEEEAKEEAVEIPTRVLESSPKVSETINEEKEESNSTGSSEFERISNSEANDMPDNEDSEQVEPKVEIAQTEEAIETSQVEPKIEMEETRFHSFVDTTLEGQCEPEKATPDEESCVTESPESEDSKMSMHVNFDSEDILKTTDIVQDEDEVIEASKSDDETSAQASPEQVFETIPVIAQTTSTTEVTETIEERSNSPSIRTEPSDDEDPLEELKSSSPILVSDQDVELVKKELEKSTESVEETEKVNESNIEKKKEPKTEGETEDAFIDTEEDIVKTIDIVKLDAAVDALMGDAPIIANEGIKLEQDDSLKADVHEKPTVPTSEPAVESEPAAVEKQMDESLTGIEEYVPEESIVQTEDSTLADDKSLSESSEKDVGNESLIETNITLADESLTGLELPELECTAVGDEIQDGKWADNTILSSAGDVRAGDLKAAVEDDVSEQEIKKAQLQEINKMLEEHNMLGDDVKVDDQVKIYTG